ncbi:MAG: hypothetical protein JSS46_08230 [Proteobacteria bacterium]|nr:hypothetical protein [Pseudomonadota bacterium]
MHAHRPTGWLRPLLTLAALAGVLSLAACGGGGGSPNNPYQPGGGALTITPASASGYSGVPFTLTISGGTPPYTAASSNPALLAVPAEASGTSLVVLPGTVATATGVAFTVTDSLGRQQTSTFTVNPMLFLPASITITGNTNCAASGATLCSGQDGTASVQVTGPGGGPLANRPVRFDVVQGNFTISPPGGSPVTSLVVNTDQNGNATVRLVVAVSAPTQIATISATDVTSGSQVLGQFTIAQYTNGASLLTVIPSTVTFTGPDSANCTAGAQASFYIFGGTPPYTVVASFPQAVTIRGAPVLSSGGGFTITTTGICVNPMTLVITDATGRTATSPTVINQTNTSVQPPPPALVVTPGSLSTGVGACSSGSSFTFLASGGTGTYANAVNPEAGATGTATVTPSGANVTVSFSTAATGVFDVNVSSGSQVVLAKLKCN